MAGTVDVYLVTVLEAGNLWQRPAEWSLWRCFPLLIDDHFLQSLCDPPWVFVRIRKFSPSEHISPVGLISAYILKRGWRSSELKWVLCGPWNPLSKAFRGSQRPKWQSWSLCGSLHILEFRGDSWQWEWGVSYSFTCFLDSFAPTGLPHPALTWRFVPGLIVSRVVFSWCPWETYSFLWGRMGVNLGESGGGGNWEEWRKSGSWGQDISHERRINKNLKIIKNKTCSE